MHTVFAIDNGLKGFVCVLHQSKVLLSKTPVAKGGISRSVLRMGQDKSADYRPSAMLELVDLALKLDSNTMFVIEEPPSNMSGKSGKHSILSQWRGYELWNAVVQIRGKMLYMVHPSTWKSYFKISRAYDKANTKQTALDLAKSLYPECSFPSTDAADACLIAVYFRNNFNVEVTSRNGRQKTRK